MSNLARYKKPEGKTLWLISFTDVIMLMLTFFVLLFSMSQPDAEKFSSASGGLNTAFKTEFGTENESGLDTPFNIKSITRTKGLNLDYLASLLDNQLSSLSFYNDIVITPLDDRIIISIPGALAFNPGSANLSLSGKTVLNNISNQLSRIDNKVEVYGHTDPSPISTDEFPSNWELSLARANSVATEFNNKGYNHKIESFGFADTRYDDLDALKDDDEQRDAIARRVDIVIKQERHS